MTHARTQIRDAMVAAIDVPAVGATIFRDRAAPIGKTDLPAIRVYFYREGSPISAARRSSGGVALDRKAYFAVHIQATGRELDDGLDTLAAAVETAIGATGDLGGLVLSCLPVQADGAPYDGSGALRAGELVLVYEVHYRTLNTAPETII
jgi:hypothetical protein